MGQIPISKRWRNHLVMKLQDRYGLAKAEAQGKADAWLLWVEKPAGPPGNAAAAESTAKRSGPPLGSRNSSRKSRSKTVSA